MMPYPGRYEIRVVALSKGQYIKVITERGQFIQLKEMAPPMLNYTRLPEPHFSDEIALRDAEWKALEATRWDEC